MTFTFATCHHLSLKTVTESRGGPRHVLYEVFFRNSSRVTLSHLVKGLGSGPHRQKSLLLLAVLCHLSEQQKPPASVWHLAEVMGLPPTQTQKAAPLALSALERNRTVQAHVCQVGTKTLVAEKQAFDGERDRPFHLLD